MTLIKLSGKNYLLGLEWHVDLMEVETRRLQKEAKKKKGGAWVRRKNFRSNLGVAITTAGHLTSVSSLAATVADVAPKDLLAVFSVQREPDRYWLIAVKDGQVISDKALNNENDARKAWNDAQAISYKETWAPDNITGDPSIESRDLIELLRGSKPVVMARAQPYLKGAIAASLLVTTAIVAFQYWPKSAPPVVVQPKAPPAPVIQAWAGKVAMNPWLSACDTARYPEAFVLTGWSFKGVTCEADKVSYSYRQESGFTGGVALFEEQWFAIAKHNLNTAQFAYDENGAVASIVFPGQLPTAKSAKVVEPANRIGDIARKFIVASGWVGPSVSINIEPAKLGISNFKSETTLPVSVWLEQFGSPHATITKATFLEGRWLIEGAIYADEAKPRLGDRASVSSWFISTANAEESLQPPTNLLSDEKNPASMEWVEELSKNAEEASQPITPKPETEAPAPKDNDEEGSPQPMAAVTEDPEAMEPVTEGKIPATEAVTASKSKPVTEEAGLAVLPAKPKSENSKPSFAEQLLKLNKEIQLQDLKNKLAASQEEGRNLNGGRPLEGWEEDSQSPTTTNSTAKKSVPVVVTPRFDVVAIWGQGGGWNLNAELMFADGTRLTVSKGKTYPGVGHVLDISKDGFLKIRSENKVESFHRVKG